MKFSSRCLLLDIYQSMQAYSCINCILQRPDSSFSEFEQAMLSLRIEKETYLNLFLTAVACRKSQGSQFNRYVDLLLTFRSITGKKSADINYVGYKDRISVFMHSCRHASPQNIQYLLSQKSLNLNATDPTGRNALFYALANPNQSHAQAILHLLIDAQPQLIQAVTDNNTNALFEAVEIKRFGLVELLLRRGSDPNVQRKDNEQTISHFVLKNYRENKEETIRVLLMLLQHGGDFYLQDREGRSVFEAALEVGLDLSECARCLQVKSHAEGDQEEEDKESLTTLNQMTKQGDNASDMEEIQSNICSQKINFSQADFQEDQVRSIGDSISCCDEENEAIAETKEVDFQVLSREISEFAVSCQQRQRNVWICIQPFLSSLQKLAQKQQLMLQVVGSFATGLWSSSSDIDINLIPADNEYRNFEATLERVYKTLKNRRAEFGISEIFFNKNKVSTIKLELNAKYGSMVVDIAVFYRNNQNRTYVTYILDSLNLYPHSKPLFLLFKKICETFHLHDHLCGGVKTYTLFLMIFSIVKNLHTQSLGELFNQIALYYGFYFEFDFEKTSIQGRMKGEDVENFPKAVFNFMDPLNPINNVGGKSTHVRQVQNMFRAIYLALGQLQEPPYLHQLFQLHSIF